MALPIVLHLGVRAAQALLPQSTPMVVRFSSKQAGAALGAAAGVALHPMLPGPKRPAGVTESYDIDPQSGRPSQTGGRALPAALQNARPEGYRITPSAQLRVWPSGKPVNAVHTQTQPGGFAPLAAPRKGEHILLAQDHSGKPGRRAMADYPKAPVATRDHSKQFDVEPVYANGPLSEPRRYMVSLNDPALEEAFHGNVDTSNGALSFAVHKVPHMASGGDLFIGAIKALQKKGVDVHQVIGDWSDGPPYTSNQTSFYKTLGETDGGTLPRTDRAAIAAASTYTGKMAGKYGFMPIRVTYGTGPLGALFADPLETKLNQLARLGSAFVTHIKQPPAIEIDPREVEHIAAHTETPSQEKSVFEYSAGQPAREGATLGLSPIENHRLSLQRWPAVAERGLQSAQRDATLLARLLQAAQQQGIDVDEIVMLHTASPLIAEGFKFLTEQLSMSERKAVDHLPITRTFKALGFEPDELFHHPSLGAWSVLYKKTASEQ